MQLREQLTQSLVVGTHRSALPGGKSRRRV
jgi:hypothetical protein